MLVSAAMDFLLFLSNIVAFHKTSFTSSSLATHCFIARRKHSQNAGRVVRLRCFTFHTVLKAINNCFALTPEDLKYIPSHSFDTNPLEFDTKIYFASLLDAVNTFLALSTHVSCIPLLVGWRCDAWAGHLLPTTQELLQKVSPHNFVSSLSQGSKTERDRHGGEKRE